MPDNDILCQGISRRWGTAYTQLVQWQIDLQAIARSHLIALKGELKDLGNSPLYHLRDQARHFLSKQAEFLAGNISPLEEYEFIRRNAQYWGGNKRGMNLAQDVSQKYSSQFLETGVPVDPFYPMTRSYIEDVYISRCEAPVRRNAEIPSDIINYRFGEIRPLVNVGMDDYAKQLVRNPDVNVLSVPRGFAPSKFKSDDDIVDYLGESIRMN